MKKISATIISFNEENNIERCIQSLRFADEIVVIDSFSSDQTCQIATSLGAKVIQNKFDGYGQQKNFACDQSSYDWIFSIDADEEVSEKLCDTLQEWKKSDEAPPLFCFKRVNFLGTKKILHGGFGKDYVSRLYHRERVRWSTPFVHEKCLAHDGSSAKLLEGELLHYTYLDLAHHMETTLKYAKLDSQRVKGSFLDLFIKAPFKFLERYILKKGFLDGKIGFMMALNTAHGHFLKYALSYLSKKKN